MIENKEPLRDKYQTANRIKSLVRDYANDLKAVSVVNGKGQKRLCDLSLADFFNYVKNIPYRKDPSPLEIISRPYHILQHQNLGMDCKKKSILMGAYCKLNGIPFRFIASSKRKDKKVHHIFPQIYDESAGQWRNIDATYPEYRPFEKKILTYAEVL
jgi:hypothetical protein